MLCRKKDFSRKCFHLEASDESFRKVTNVVHFHLRYFPRRTDPETILSTGFFSEMEASNAAALANATRGADSGYYSVQMCNRPACRPQHPDNEPLLKPLVTGMPGRSRRVPAMLN